MEAPKDMREIDRFTTELVPGANSRELVVMLSSGANFTMRRRTFGRDVLHVAAKGSPYYLRNPHGLADLIREVGAGYDRVLLWGGSKSGFAALMLAGLMAPRGYQRVLAMSPQVRLWPRDESLPFPSYHGMFDTLVPRDKEFARSLHALGDQSGLGDVENIHITVVYPELSSVDSAQASLLQGYNVRKIPLHTAAHNTTMFFGPRPVDETRLRAKLEAKYNAEADDEDLAATRPDADLLSREVARAVWLPTLDQLMDQVIAVG